MAPVSIVSIILGIFLITVSLMTMETEGKKLNPGTNYEVDEADVVEYLLLGQPCDPSVQMDNTRKTGRCRATLVCNPETRLCDCEDIGGYKYTAENGKCKNYVGSDCFAAKGNPQGNCVENAECTSGKCVCKEGKTCTSRKIAYRI